MPLAVNGTGHGSTDRSLMESCQLMEEMYGNSTLEVSTGHCLL
jgi:hypothetical protein